MATAARNALDWAINNNYPFKEQGHRKRIAQTLDVLFGIKHKSGAQLYAMEDNQKEAATEVRGFNRKRVPYIFIDKRPLHGVNSEPRNEPVDPTPPKSEGSITDPDPSPEEGSCTRDPRTAGYTDNYRQTITLCPNVFATFPEGPAEGGLDARPAFTMQATVEKVGKPTRGDYLHPKYYTRSGLLLHEITHWFRTLKITDKPSVDEQGQATSPAGNSYGFRLCRNLAKSAPKDARGNADTFRLFATAMSDELRGCNWHTGRADCAADE
ncbi:MAG: hypothetical protein M1837_003309 [Sclerophora amabilis]|nr:MAG: hypothetical protein M1837_003309 [Sclerophora amabilis]